jgi:hypothetical protein
MSAATDYALGYSAGEERRLALQARMFGRLTEDLLRHAGIGAGMHVLDIGCGVGDVSFLAAPPRRWASIRSRQGSAMKRSSRVNR